MYLSYNLIRIVTNIYLLTTLFLGRYVHVIIMIRKLLIRIFYYIFMTSSVGGRYFNCLLLFTSSMSLESQLISTYNRQLKDNIKAIAENYTELLQCSKVKQNDLDRRESFTFEQSRFEMLVRSQKIVRAAEALAQLSSDIKEHILLNDFSLINKSIDQHTAQIQEACQRSKGEIEELRKTLIELSSQNQGINYDNLL